MGVLGNLKGGLKSSAGFALICFFLINFLLSLLESTSGLDLINVDLFQNRAVFESIARGGKPADLLFMGSSVMEVPLSLLDDKHTYVEKPEVARKLISEAAGRQISVRNVSIEAALLSDQFILLRHLIRVNQKPQAVVLAIAPRDLTDARLPSASLTSTFKTYVTLRDMDIVPYFAKSLDDYLQFFWRRMAPLYRLRRATRDFFQYQLVMLDQMVTAKLGIPVLILPQDKAPSASTDEPSILTASGSAERDRRFLDSYREYKFAYSLIGKSSLDKDEMQFLPRYIELAKENGIRLLLINMPLTAANKSLLPAGFYEYYSRELKKTTEGREVVYLDLDGSKSFEENTDFFDTGHLNSRGGRKLITAITPFLKQFFSNTFGE